MSWKLTFLTAVAIVAVAGVAVAAKGGGSRDVTLCAAKKGGRLSLAPKSGKCAKGTKKLVIARQGPQGVPGSAGPAGPAGPAGRTASIQPEAVRFLTGPVDGGCAAHPGSFCGATFEGGAQWHAYEDWGPAGFQKDAAGYVHLQGGTAFSGSGVMVSRIFFLPPGYRPSAKIQVAATECDGTPISILIGTDGEVLPAPIDLPCIVLDGVSFRP